MKLSATFSAAALTLVSVQGFSITNNFAGLAEPSFVTSRAAAAVETTTLVEPMTEHKNRLGFLGRIFRRNLTLEGNLKAKAQAIKTKAQDGLHTLEEHLDQALQRQTDEIINIIALDVVTLLEGHWDFSVATTNKDDAAATKSIMEGRIEELANDLIDLGVADEQERGTVKQGLRNSRLQIKQTFDGSDYPLRLQQEVFLGSRSVIQLYGQLQFDLLEHDAVYSLDELVVLGTNVDLNEIMIAPVSDEIESQGTTVELNAEATIDGVDAEFDADDFCYYFKAQEAIEEAKKSEADLDMQVKAIDSLYC